MSIIKWSPFLESFEDMDKFFTDFVPAVPAKGFMPAVDVYQDKSNVYIEATLAGVDPNDIDILIDNDVLTMKGKMEKKTEVDEKNYYRQEVRKGSFFRSIPLPAHVAGDKAKAEYENGILKVSIPKKAEVKSKTIKIDIKKNKK